MEKLLFEFPATKRRKGGLGPVLVGVVSSGNLEVLVEGADFGGNCQIEVNTSATGFGVIWQAVMDEFAARYDLGDVRISINDGGATPAVVSLRLDQAMEEFFGRCS